VGTSGRGVAHRGRRGALLRHRATRVAGVRRRLETVVGLARNSISTLDDETEVEDFIQTFDHNHDVLISRGIGAGMAGDVIIGSNDADYIKQRIRTLYLRDSTVTIVIVGQCTSARRFVDWEVAASLRNTSTTARNGLLATHAFLCGGRR